MTKRIKILQIVTKSNWGGAQKQVFDIANNLDNKIFDVVVLAGGDGLLFRRLEEKNIRYYKINQLQRNLSIMKEIQSFIKIIRIIKNESPDIVHLHSPKAGGIGAFASRLAYMIYRKKNRIIYTSHGWTFSEKVSILKKIFIKIFSWITILLSDKTIVLSKSEFDKVKHWPFASKKLIIIPNGVDNIDFLPREDARKIIESKSSKKLEQNMFVVGTIAELHRNKSLDTAIRSLGKTKDIHYVIIGEGEERENLERVIKDQNIENVTLLGFLENASSLLRAFDIFLLPSIKEGMPYVLLEAGLAKIPVIATNVGSIVDLIIDKTDGILINPRNEKDIKNAVSLIREDPLFADSLSKTFYEKIQSRYSIKLMLKNIHKIYTNDV